jgi:tRNA modification GTPase
MPLRWDDTIAALASPPGPGWRGIVRLTGPNVLEVLAPVFHRGDGAPRLPIRMEAEGLRPLGTSPGRYPGFVRWPGFRAAVPADLQLWPTSRSYTGQPLAELHLVSSPPLLERILGELFRRGARPARPGEFTLRAFLAGRIDLMQAEAVLGVIDAHDDAELRTALGQLAGGVSQSLVALRNDLLNLLADLEAGLDFVDEHLQFVSRQEIHARLAAARLAVERLQDEAEGRLHSSDRPRVVLAGRPNAGKSTLFNALIGRAQALVSPLAGTTRDYLTAHLQWEELPIELIDTAGVSVSGALPSVPDTFSDIDSAAQELRHEQWQHADLVIWCTPGDLADDERAADDADFADACDIAPRVVRVGTKTDLARDVTLPFGVSAATAEGLGELRAAIHRALTEERARGRHWLGVTAARCRDTLHSAHAALVRAEELSAGSPGIAIPGTADDDLLAIELRDALDHLGQIVGAVYTEDLLDRIFSRFCIGK